MSKRGCWSRGCCLCCVITTIIGLGLLSLFAWLITNQIRSPKCSIEKFYVQALDKALSSNKTDATTNTTISFDLIFKNENGDGFGVYYDALNISLYYQKSYASGYLNSLPIGNVSLPGFYQAKVDHRLATVQTFGVPWEEVRMEIANGGTAKFLFNLTSNVKLKIPLNDAVRTTDKRKFNLGVNVNVNDQGKKTVPGSLRLTSASPRMKPCSILVLVLSALGFYFSVLFLTWCL
ncbi:protein NDR1-like [Papaver somniferum]|uniref:protein NDR1-like n=1 Tax=Papaver somniferum TaxID=3469 RepID=UPI000E6FB653|nr:protein NDR1-like [Papaver somniferum]